MPAAFERCLHHVEGKVRNKYAACTAVNAGNIKEYRKHEHRHGVLHAALKRRKKRVQ